MPLAAYTYPQPAYSSPGSGVNNLHPAPPGLADGIYYSPPAPHPCGYPPHYATPAPPYCCPYADPRLHHCGVFPQSIPHTQYPHLHYFHYSSPPDGMPSHATAAPDNVCWQDGRAAHGKPPLGPPFASSNHRSPQLVYPQMPAMPLWRPLDPDKRPPCNEDAASEVEAAGRGYEPTHSIVPLYDKVQGAKPNNSYDGTPQWRGFPVMWKGDAPFALVPLSNIDGEQNLLVPKKVSPQSAPEQPQNANAYVDWPLLARNHSPIMWKQGSIPAATHDDGKVKLNAMDSPNDEVSNSKRLPVVWDGKSPLVLMPAMNEAGKESAGLMPFKLLPSVKEAGDESRKLQPHAFIPSDEKQQDPSKSLTKNALVTAPSEDEKGPIKVIPVVQLPTIDSSMPKEVSVQKEPPSNSAPRVVDVIDDVAGGQAGGVHTKPQVMQQVGKTKPHAQHVSKQDTKGPSQDPPLEKKSFPAIKLLPLSDAKRCPRKSAATAQQKPAVQGTQGVKPDGCQGDVTIPSRDASLHEKGSKDASLHGRDSGLNGADVKLVPSVNADGKAANEAVLPKAVEVKLAPSVDGDGKATEESVFTKQKSLDVKVSPIASVRAAERPQAPWASESEKPYVKMMSQDSAAKCIQALYRGYCVRRLQPLAQLRIIKEVQANMPDILKQLDSKVEALKEPMERRKLSESIMALLLKLDTVQGHLPYVREQRKSVAKELSRVLEALDNIEQEKASSSVNELATEQEDISTLKAVTDGGIGCSSSGTMDREMIVDKVANLTRSASNAHALDISKEVEGVAVSESSENVLALSDDSIREEMVGTGSESGVSEYALELPPAALQVESMDEKVKVDPVTLVAFDPCGSLKEQIDPCECVSEQRIQYTENRGEEEVKEDQCVEVPPKAADIKDGVKFGSESAAVSDRDAVGIQAEAGVVVTSLPTKVLVREMDEYANLENDDFNHAAHIAKQDDQLDVKVEEKPEDVIEELKEEAAVPSPSMELIGEENIEEHMEPSLVAQDFEDSVQSQQLDVATGKELNEEKEVSRLLPEVAQEVHAPLSNPAEVAQEVHAPPSNPAEVLPETKCVEPPSVTEDHIVGEATVDGLELGSKVSNKASEVLVGQSRVEPLGSINYAMEVGLKQEGEDTIPRQNLQAMTHEEFAANVSCGDEGDTALTSQEKLVGVQQVEERGSSLSFDAADVEMLDDSTRLSVSESKDDTHLHDDSTRLSICESMDETHLHGDVKVEQPLLFDGYVGGNIEDETVKIKDVSIDSIRLDNAGALDSQSNDDTDAANVLAAICPIKEGDYDLKNGSMLDAPMNKCACDNEKITCCIQELVDITPTKMVEDIDRNQVILEESGIPLEIISVDSCMLHAGNEQNLCPEKSGPKVQCNAMDESTEQFLEKSEEVKVQSDARDESAEQLLAKPEEVNMQKHCFENLALESKNLLAVVEKLMEWNQQQASLITQLSERMNRLEDARNPKHTFNNRKGRSRRRKISVHM